MRISKDHDWSKHVSQLKSGRLYFYVGAGLSTAAGLVGWEDMAHILSWYLEHYEKDPGVRPWLSEPSAEENAKFLEDFVNEPRPSKRARFLSRKTADPRVLGRVALLNLLLRYRAPNTKIGGTGESPAAKYNERERCGEEPTKQDLELQSLLWEANCHGVLTSNYDMLLEHAFSLYDHGAALRFYRYDADFLRYVMSNRRFVLKLHGDINDIRSMQFNPTTAWKKGGKLAGKHGYDLKMVYSTALREGHMVYVGMGFRDSTIVELHKYASNHLSSNVRLALVPRWELNRITENSLFNDITFLTYGTEKPFSVDRARAVREFLEQLVEARNYGTHRKWRPCREASDIRDQIFLSGSERPKQTWWTQEWTCRGVRVRRKQS
jgi:SIR2-like protein